MKLDPMTPQVCVCQLGNYDARFAVHNDFFHRAMEPNPTNLDGVRQCLFLLVRDKGACMPACASVQQVKDHVFVDKQKVALGLLIKSVRDVYTAHVLWRAWPTSGTPYRCRRFPGSN